MGRNRLELTGRKFGSWTVLDYAFMNPDGKSIWTCKCDCGVVPDVSGTALTQGRSKNCGKRGAHPYKHGDCINGKSTTEYSSWHMMIQRCENKKADGYSSYGGRGITVCKRWKRFENFLVDMGRRPSKNHLLDRMNKEKGYRPSNCRWATRKEQMRNTRNSRNKRTTA